VKLDRLRPHIRWQGPDPEPWTAREAFWCAWAVVEALLIFLMVSGRLA